MRMLQALGALGAIEWQPSRYPPPPRMAFDACTVFTQDDAENGARRRRPRREPVNPKVKRPKVVLGCTYTGFKDSKPVAATVQFKFGTPTPRSARPSTKRACSSRPSPCSSPAPRPSGAPRPGR